MYAKSIGSLVLMTALIALATGVAAGNAAASEDEYAKGLLDLPAANAERLSEAEVVAEAPFNRFVRLKCNSNNSSCFARIPAVKKNERLEVRFVSCAATTGFDSTMRHIYLLVTDAKITKQLGFHYLAPTYRAPLPPEGPDVPHDYAVSQPMLLTVEATNILHVGTTAIGTIGSVECALSGVRQKLK